MNIVVTYTGGTPNPETIAGTTLRTVAVGATFFKEGEARQIQGIEVTPANSTEHFTLEIRPGTGINTVQAQVLEGSATSSVLDVGGGVHGASVLHATNSTDNLVTLRLRTPPDLEAVAAPASARDPEDLAAIGPALIKIKVKVKHP